jgi:hypothetical protein
MQLFFQAVFFLVCLALGVGLVHEGAASVRDRAYTLEYTESSSWATESAFGVNARDNVLQYRDGEAVVFGVGLGAAGVMLISWAAGLAISLAGHAGAAAPAGLMRTLGAFSLAGLIASCVTLFPIWRRHTIPLYLVVLAFTLAVTLPIPAAARKKVFPAMVGLVILVGMTGFPAFPIFAGIFVFVIAGTNLLVLWPGLKARVERSQRGSGARRVQ